MASPKQSSSASKSEPPKILLKADQVTVDLKADKEGRIRVNCGSFETPAVVLPGQVLEVRNQAGQVVLVKRDMNGK